MSDEGGGPADNYSETTVHFPPHQDTYLESGNHEYYGTDGREAFAHALAELVDNALAATARVPRAERQIIIEMHKDARRVIVRDNGHGLSKSQLIDWARYRMSQDRRDNCESLPRVRGDRSRFLNSAISKFGVGSKQASFYMGTGVRMISSPAGADDVLELELSRDRLNSRGDAGEDVFQDSMLQRQKGVVLPHHAGYERLVEAELSENSSPQFTSVVVQGIKTSHINNLDSSSPSFRSFKRTLAQIYHYYVHGENGNTGGRVAPASAPLVKIILQEWSGNTLSDSWDLRKEEEDMESLYLRTCADSINFVINPPQKDASVQAQLRYHPYLENHESLPVPFENDIDVAEDAIDRKHDVFTCYWNGRLVGETGVKTLPFCDSYSADNVKKSSKLLCEDEASYSRLSGTIWLSDPYSVTHNKLTFTDDLRKILGDSRNDFVLQGKTQNRQLNYPAFEREVLKWINKCHKKYDKQIEYSKFTKDLVKKDSDVFTKCLQLKTQDHVFKQGDKVKVGSRNKAKHPGSIESFLLRGDHRGKKAVYHSTGITAQATLSVMSKYGNEEVQTVAVNELVGTQPKVQHISESDYKKFVAEFRQRLPASLLVRFRTDEGGALEDLTEDHPGVMKKNGKSVFRPLAQLSAMQVDLLDGTGKIIHQRDVGSSYYVRQTFLFYPDGYAQRASSESILNHQAQFNAAYGYWFKKVMSLKKQGDYALELSLHYNQAGGGGTVTNVPVHRLMFRIEAGDPDSLNITRQTKGAVQLDGRVDFTIETYDEHRNLLPLSAKLHRKGCTGKHPEVHLKDGKAKSKGNNRLVGSFKIVPRTESMKGGLLSKKGKECNINLSLGGVSGTLPVLIVPGAPHALELLDNEDSHISLQSKKRVPHPSLKVFDKWGNEAYKPDDSPWQVLASVRRGKREVATWTYGVQQGTGKPVNRPFVLKESEKPATDEPVEVTLQLLDVHTKWNTPAAEAKRNHTLEGIEPVKLSATMLPSGIPHQVCIYQEDGTPFLSKNPHIVGLAGSVLENRRFSLLDEWDVPVAITKQYAGSISISWEDAKNRAADVSLYSSGILPPIPVQIPTDGREDQSHWIMLEVASQTIVKADFTVRAKPGPPAFFLLEFLETSCQWGVPLASNMALALQLRDEHDLPVSIDFGTIEQPQFLSEGWDTSKMSRITPRASATPGVAGVVDNMVYTGDEIGEVRVTVGWCGFEAETSIRVLPGVPTGVQWYDWKWDPNPGERLEVYQGRLTHNSFDFMLMDSRGRTIRQDGDARSRIKLRLQASRGLKVWSSKPRAVELTRHNLFFKPNSEGLYQVGNLKITATPASGEEHWIQFADSNGSPFEPRLDLLVTTDPTKVCSLCVTFIGSQNADTYDDWPLVATKDDFCSLKEPLPVEELQDALLVEAGSVVRPIAVHLVNRDDAIIRASQASGLGDQDPHVVTLTLCKGKAKSGVSWPAHAQQGPAGAALFKDVTAPTAAGEYTMLFKLGNGTSSKVMRTVNLTVSASVAASLVPWDRRQKEVQAPVIAHGSGLGRLVDEFPLKLVDKYSNQVLGIAAMVDQGELAVVKSLEVVAENAQEGAPIPQLASGTIGLGNDTIIIQNLSIDTTSAAPSGAYHVRVGVFNGVEPFRFFFQFENNIEEIARKKSLLEKKRQLEDDLGPLLEQRKALMRQRHEAKERLQLGKRTLQNAAATFRRSFPKAPVPAAAREVKNRIQFLQQSLKAEEQRSRGAQERQELQPDPSFADDPDVVGFAGNLCTVEDDDICRMLTYGMGKQMKTVVTTTKERAKRLAQQTGQSVLPIETTRKPTESLPFRESQAMRRHNATYILNQVTLKPSEKDVERALQALVGKWVFVPDLDAGNALRKELNGEVGRILTRDGFEIQGNGVFHMRKPMTTPLRDMPATFGKPVSTQSRDIQREIQALKQFLPAALDLEEAERGDASSAGDQHQFRDVYSAVEKLQQQLHVVDKELGYSNHTRPQSVSGGKRKR